MTLKMLIMLSLSYGLQCIKLDCQAWIIHFSNSLKPSIALVANHGVFGNC